jgi:uncharacterized membrane protein (DUF485 family)
MLCRKCSEPIDFSPSRTESLKRFRQFIVFSSVLMLTGLMLYVLEVPIWPWWLGGMSAFVLSQALLKWHDSRWVICRRCKEGYSYYGRD